MEDINHCPTHSSDSQGVVEASQRPSMIRVRRLTGTADLSAAQVLPPMSDLPEVLRNYSLQAVRVIDLLCQFLMMVSSARTVRRDLTEHRICYWRVTDLDTQVELLLDTQLSKPARDPREHMLRNSEHVITINKLIEVASILQSTNADLLRSFKKSLDKLLADVQDTDENFWERLCSLPEISYRCKLQQLQAASLQFYLSNQFWQVYATAVEDMRKLSQKLEAESRLKAADYVLQEAFGLVSTVYKSKNFRGDRSSNPKKGNTSVWFQFDMTPKVPVKSLERKYKNLNVPQFRISVDIQYMTIKTQLLSDIMIEIQAIDVFEFVCSYLESEASNILRYSIQEAQLAYQSLSFEAKSEKAKYISFWILQPIRSFEEMYHSIPAWLDTLQAAYIALKHEMHEIPLITSSLAKRLLDSLPLELEHYLGVVDCLSEALERNCTDRLQTIQLRRQKDLNDKQNNSLLIPRNKGSKYPMPPSEAKVQDDLDRILRL